MAKDVDAALRKIVQEHGGKSVDEANAYVDKLKSYKRDVYQEMTRLRQGYGVAGEILMTCLRPASARQANDEGMISSRTPSD